MMIHDSVFPGLQTDTALLRPDEERALRHQQKFGRRTQIFVKHKLPANIGFILECARLCLKFGEYGRLGESGVGHVRGSSLKGN